MASKQCVQVPDEELVERVTGRRLDPETNTIYHMKFKPPPEAIVGRLIQRSDDTEDKLRNRLETHHKNVEAVVGYYKDILVEVRLTVHPMVMPICQLAIMEILTQWDPQTH